VLIIFKVFLGGIDKLKIIIIIAILFYAVLMTAERPYLPAEEFHKAVINGKIEQVEASLEKNSRFAVKSYGYGRYPIMDAAKYGHLHILKLLIKYGAKIDAYYLSEESTPLFYAAKNGYFEIVKLLITQGARLDYGFGIKPLLFAVVNNSYDITKYLIEQGVNINGRIGNSESLTPLHLASFYGYKKIAAMLLENGASIDLKCKAMNEMTSLHMAAMNGHAEIVSLLLKYGAKEDTSNKFGDLPAHAILGPSHLSPRAANQFKFLIQREFLILDKYLKILANQKQVSNPWVNSKGKADSLLLLTADKKIVNHQNKQGNALIHLATIQGDIKTVKLLIKKGASIEQKNKRGDFLIHLAIKNKHYALANYLLKYEKVVNKKDIKGNTPLHLAMYENSTELLKIILSYQPDIFIKNKEKQTALTVIGSYNSRLDDMLKEIEQSKEVALVDKYKNTALHYACEVGNLNIVLLLLYLKADVDAWNNDLQTPLYKAVIRDQLQIVKLLLKHKADIKIKDKNKNNLLHIAATRDFMDSLETVKLLIKKGADLNELNSYNKTPLFMALEYNPVIAKFLIEQGANLNQQDVRKYTPLLVAIRYNRSELVKLLISKSANINYQRSDCWTPLHEAVYHKNASIVKILLKAGIKPDKCYDSAVQNAAYSSDNKSLELLLKKGVDINVSKNVKTTPLLEAIQGKNIEGIKLLLQYNALINQKNRYGTTPLHLAVEKRNIEIIKLLLKHGANPYLTDKNKRTPLIKAIEENQFAIFKMILSASSQLFQKDDTALPFIRAVIKTKNQKIINHLMKKKEFINYLDKDKNTVLIMSVKYNNFDFAKLLLEKGVNINHKNNKNETAIFYALKDKTKIDRKLISLLLEYDADLNISSITKETPLHLVAKYDDLDLVEQILEYQADLNVLENKNNSTPLYVAFKKDKINKPIVKFLIKKKSNLNIIDNQKYTALHYAVKTGDLNLVKRVLKYGADINGMVKQTGYTPLHLAADKNYYSIAIYLINNGADVNLMDNGYGPLYSSISWRKECIPLIKLLLKRGVKVNIQNKYGYTPLHQAYLTGNQELINLLIKSGADNTIKNDSGKVPSDLKGVKIRFVDTE